MTAKKGIGSYPENAPEGDDAQPDKTGTRGAHERRQNDGGELNTGEIERQHERYKDEMAEDAPASGTREDRE